MLAIVRVAKYTHSHIGKASIIRVLYPGKYSSTHGQLIEK